MFQVDSGPAQSREGADARTKFSTQTVSRKGPAVAFSWSVALWSGPPSSNVYFLTSDITSPSLGTSMIISLRGRPELRRPEAIPLAPPEGPLEPEASPMKAERLSGPRPGWAARTQASPSASVAPRW